MSARSGMSTLIETIRGYCDLGVDDYQVNETLFWADAEIQRVLDRFRTEVVNEELKLVSEQVAGDVVYLRYHSRFGSFEKTTGGTAIFFIEDVDGTRPGTADWTPDYSRGVITFDSDTGGSVYWLTGRSYDLDGAAGEIWRMKAGHYHKAVDIKTDNTSMTRSQLIKNCLEMARIYTSQGGFGNVDIERTDT